MSRPLTQAELDAVSWFIDELMQVGIPRPCNDVQIAGVYLERTDNGATVGVIDVSTYVDGARFRVSEY